MITKRLTVRQCQATVKLLGSFYIDGRGHLQIIAVQRALGEATFTPREVRLLWLFHRELIPMVGRDLATFEAPTTADMSRRLRQTLICLLHGDSERQVADRLGIASHTVHEYVKKLHRHFDVSSRAELLARCIGLYPVLTKLERDWSEHFTVVAAQS